MQTYVNESVKDIAEKYKIKAEDAYNKSKLSAIFDKIKSKKQPKKQEFKDMKEFTKDVANLAGATTSLVALTNPMTFPIGILGLLTLACIDSSDAENGNQLNELENTMTNNISKLDDELEKCEDEEQKKEIQSRISELKKSKDILNKEIPKIEADAAKYKESNDVKYTEKQIEKWISDHDNLRNSDDYPDICLAAIWYAGYTEEDFKYIASITEDDTFIYDLEDQVDDYPDKKTSILKAMDFFKEKKLGLITTLESKDGNSSVDVYYCLSDGKLYNYNEDDVPCMSTTPISFSFLVNSSKNLCKSNESIKIIDSDLRLDRLKESAAFYGNVIEATTSDAYCKLDLSLKYSGFKSDIVDVRRVLNYVEMNSLVRELGLEKLDISNIKVTVTEKDIPFLTNDKEIIVVSRRVYEENYNGTYDNYLMCNAVAYLLFNVNPKCDSRMVYAIARWKSNLILDYKEEGLDGMHWKYGETLDAMVKSSHNYSKIIKMVDKNSNTAAMKQMMKDYKGRFLEAKDDHDWSVDGIPKLVRRIKMNTRNAVHGINAVERNVEDFTDLMTPNPDIDQDGDDRVEKDERQEKHTADLLPTKDKIAAHTAVNTPGAAPAAPQSESFSLDSLDESDYITDGETILVIGEASSNANYNTMLKKALYNDRMVNNKQIYKLYNDVKNSNSAITKTFLTLDRYKGYNLYTDMSFYNTAFFKNNMLERERGLMLYAELLKRFINDSRYTEAGYSRSTVLIPVLDWNINPYTKMWIYTQNINPISVIYRLMHSNPGALVDIFGEKDVVFCGKYNYFKMNMNLDLQRKDCAFKFLELIKKLIKLGVTNEVEPDPADEPMTDSPKAIATDIVDKLEKSQNIKISKMNFSGDKPKGLYDKEKQVKSIGIDPMPKDKDLKDIPEPKATKAVDATQDDLNKEIIEKNKEELMNAINTAANSSTSTDDAIEKLDNERVKKLIADLAEEENGNQINKARAARMTSLHDKFLDQQIKDKSVKDMLDPANNMPTDKLESTDLDIASINKEWQDMTYANFGKNYNMDADILKMLDSMSKWSMPIATRNITVEDDSTSEDYLDLWKVECEDSFGKRFTLKFDVPKFVNDNKYLKLRGNNKTLESQFTLMPILKTDTDAAQIVSNYKKIFIRRYNMIAGKSSIISDKIVRALKKYKGTDIKVYSGDNSKVCSKYDLPIQYIDLASIYDKIETTNCIIYFNQDEIREKYDVDNSKGIPYAVSKNSTDPKKWYVMYYSGGTGSIDYAIMDRLTIYDDFRELFESIPRATKYCYTRASILNSDIPLVIILGYHEGLTSILKREGITYNFKEKLGKTDRSSMDSDWIRFEDGYLIYDASEINASILLNGLKECNTEYYKLSDIDTKAMYTDFLGNFCDRIKTDGLDNFYDCMIDPITKETLEHYKLPTDYIGCLLYANDLLADNKFIKHTDTSSRRLRRAEIVAGYVYQALTDSYGMYSVANKHSRAGTPMTMKQTSVIDKFMLDPTEKDLSINNMLNDIEAVNAVSTKGLVGMNSDRSYSLDKRTYDESMLNVLGMSTGFAGNVGVTRQATLDMNVDGTRGYIKGINGDTSKLGDVKSLTATEAISPFGVTHNDPFRTAMTFVQKSKHSMRCYNEDPLLVTNGAEEALPYLASDIFAHKAKGKGTVTELVPDKYMIIEYKDGTPNEYVDLSTRVEKNSDGGFYVPLKLDTDIKVGNSVKPGQIVAADKLSIGNTLGETNAPAYKAGTLAKVAILNTDEGFEDSAIMSDRLSKALACDVIKVRDVELPKNTNIYNVLHAGSHIEEGDQMMLWQTPYDSDDLNILQRNLAGDNEELSALGRNPVKAECTGTLIEVRMYRCVELDELSPSLRKLFNAYEKPIREQKKVLEAKGIPTYTLPPTYALPSTGKMKHCEDGVRIEFCQQYTDIPAIGDKIVWQDANKGVNKALFPVGQEPYTDLRPNEVIDGFITSTSINGRMVCSIPEYGALAKLMVELDRTCKEICGIEFDNSKA